MRRPTWIFAALLMFCARLSFAASLDEFKQANQLYDDGHFAAAIAAYEKIEPKSAHLFYNLGNAWYRAGQMGKAIVNYERARRLAPRDPDILANLKFAEERLGVESVNTPPRVTRRLLRSVVFSRTPGEWSGYELAGLWAVTMGVGLWVWVRRGRPVWVTISILAFAWFAGAAGVLAWRVLEEPRTPAAVVVVRQVDARFAPLADATVHFKLVEGTQVRILEDRGQWWFVERADGQQGWIASGAVERVGLD